MNTFESIKIGDTAELSHLITEADIEKFVELTGDDNKLHIDAGFASKTVFKKPVVHGMLGASFISTIIGTKLPGDGALWYSQSFEFLRPVRVSDTIRVTAAVIEKNARTKSISLKTDIFNGSKQLVTTGIAKVKIIEIPEEKPEDNSPELLPHVAFVASAVGGIGRETALRLAGDGFDLVITYNRKKAPALLLQKEITALGRKCLVVQCDVCSKQSVEEAVAAAVRKFGYIKALVNCSGISIGSVKFQDLELADMMKQIDINVAGTFHLTKAIVPVMEARGYGKIIGIGTLAAEKPNAEWLHYITAKAALTGYYKALAYELGPKGIRCNLVAPGMTDTELIADIPEKVKLLTETQTPLRRIAKARDVADAICFLASEKSDYITGETLRVNGGQLMS